MVNLLNGKLTQLNPRKHRQNQLCPSYCLLTGFQWMARELIKISTRSLCIPQQILTQDIFVLRTM